MDLCIKYTYRVLRNCLVLCFIVASNMHYSLVTEYSLGNSWGNDVCIERVNQLPPFQFYPGNSHVEVGRSLMMLFVEQSVE